MTTKKWLSETENNISSVYDENGMLVADHIREKYLSLITHAPDLLWIANKILKAIHEKNLDYNMNIIHQKLIDIINKAEGWKK